MDSLLKLAEDSGMSKSQGETATGGIFSFLKESIPSDQFNKIEDQIPGVTELSRMYSANNTDGGSGGMGGMLGSAMSSFGGSSGGAGGLAGLLTTLTSKGINPSILRKFLPQVSAMVKAKCGIDISQYLGGEAAPPVSDGISSGGASGMMGQAMSMFGK